MSAKQKIVTPFTGLVKKTESQFSDPDMMKVEHGTPLPKYRTVVGKYDALFSQLKVGSCVVCEKNERHRVAGALRKFIKHKNLPNKVIAMNCEDGHARVWMVKRA